MQSDCAVKRTSKAPRPRDGAAVLNARSWANTPPPIRHAVTVFIRRTTRGGSALCCDPDVVINPVHTRERGRCKQCCGNSHNWYKFVADCRLPASEHGSTEALLCRKLERDQYDLLSARLTATTLATRAWQEHPAARYPPKQVPYIYTCCCNCRSGDSPDLLLALRTHLPTLAETPAAGNQPAYPRGDKYDRRRLGCRGKNLADTRQHQSVRRVGQIYL